MPKLKKVELKSGKIAAYLELDGKDGINVIGYGTDNEEYIITTIRPVLYGKGEAIVTWDFPERDALWEALNALQRAKYLPGGPDINAIEAGLMQALRRIGEKDL